MDKATYVLDACALIAFFNNELGAEHMERLLIQSQHGEVVILLSVINLYEVYYDCLRQGYTVASALLEDVAHLPITIVRTCSDELLVHAGFFKINEKVSLADSIALGLARFHCATLVSTDHHEFDAIEAKELVRFCWLR